MRNKIMAAITFIVFLIFLVACAKTATVETAPIKETKAAAPQTPPPAAEDAAVDSVGKDLSDAEDVQEDLSADNIIDSGLSDIEGI